MTKISIIGSGRVATQLSKKLYTTGHSIQQIYSRNFKTAQHLAKLVEAQAVQTVDEIQPNAAIYILAIKDDAIQDLIPQLEVIQDKIVTHTSGTVPSTIFEDYFDNFGVFYPLQTFSDHKEADFDTLPFCIHASNQKTQTTLINLAQSICPNVYAINDHQRASLHVAAVIVNNFSNYLFGIAHDICEQEKVSFDILKPLIRETVAKIEQHTPQTVQTGPAARKDYHTIENHLDFLEKKPIYKEIYQLLSNAIMDK